MPAHKTWLCVFVLSFFLNGLHAQYSFEPISPEKWHRAIAAAESLGVSFTPVSIVAMGFESDSKKLVILSFDSTGAPVKTVVESGPELYTAILEKRIEQRQKSLVLSTNQARESGRVYFIVTTAMRTLAIYPAGFGTALGEDNADPRTVMGLSLLTFGASLYGSYRFTKGRELGYGRVALMNYGGELATTYSFLTSRIVYGLDIYKPRVQLTTMADPIGGTITFYDTTESEKPGQILAIGSMIGFPLGIYLGSRVNLAGNYQYGNADIIRFFGRSAWLYGFLLPMYSSGDNRHAYNIAAGGLTMGLIPAGIYGGHRLTKGKDYSSGRGFLIETTGIMGGLTGLLAPMLFDADFNSVGSRRIWISSILAGHALGTAFGFKFKEENSYTFFQGVFSGFSAICGSALCLSVPLLAQAESDKQYIVAGIAGAWGGLVLGEYLARSLFEVTGQDQRHVRLNVSLPVAYQWPLLFAPHSIASRDSHATDRRIDLVQASITF
ncbi:MAG: hypothetical protein A2268_02620 [Candidatus Raymondbacteria bacterium RifOxyA12_full_50_37]|uniref:Uncharacterized protein n=1 Tax=Candidatus Raymondbacteria bacterium RIFOXYD12_FULL_49_13 TaxID=1817890 RepID=A0A1F7F607_UNCRA|nr:MAG: hypothetical protein A2268_02620 [Candidatus Raymondbacteria bacterium RifOxyA12_full_50_37]OGJ89162.1 MAG: hypothetical protein A2248_11440 [Candidatus Raymondbacteria bacterium RIFOXYA2_FULL_49_16]OGJ96644.1 MAG: hypothetical protein A2453_06555 [Candidatus Raymondbacteria bacterium RIFOXYC2_FULL_50_21]OGK01956.1 MAG: hypothetical protein A2519_17660 [Candidatus Raymondbacteria bacterium RIFOXYD12_FULL_49_13]OGK04568.1 MAG: hypothetical protein A2487_19460 [Candidatus Raymondbacteria 